MPLFEQAIPISHEDVAKIVLENWNLTLGKVIKESQNHTFMATKTKDDGTEEKFIVRVTPDPTHKHLERIEKEVAFVAFLKHDV